MQIINYGNESVTDKKISEYMGIVKRNSLKMLKLIKLCNICKKILENKIFSGISIDIFHKNILEVGPLKNPASFFNKNCA